MLSEKASIKTAEESAASFKVMPPSETMGEHYDTIEPEAYNKMCDLVNFTEKDEICKQVIETLALPKDAAIFDAGCGTGLIGEILNKAGYTTIDGADAASKWVEHAKLKGWYRDMAAFYFGCGLDKFPAQFKGKYDCCTASGVFLPNHMPPAAMDDIHCCLKTGGYFITAMREYLYVDGEEHGYKDKINELVSAGKFKHVSKAEFMRGNKEVHSLFYE